MTATKVTAGVNANPGTILQVQSVTKTDTFTTSSTSFVDITGLTISITPSSTSSTILVIACLAGHMHTGTAAGGARLVRDSTAIHVGDTSGSRSVCSFSNYTSNTSYPAGEAVTTVDSPATVSSVTYKIQCRSHTAGSFFVNRGVSSGDGNTSNVLASSIVVMEIAG